LRLKNVSGYSAVILLVLSLITSSVFAAQGRQKLHGHRNSKMAAAPLVGEVDDQKVFDLAIALPWRNPEQLKSFVSQVSDPNSQLFRHYLTSDQFTQTYGPDEASYQSVMDYLKSKGVNVTGTHSNRMLVDVRATKADIQNAFHVTIRNYQREDGSTFYGPDDEPSLDTDTPVLHISGLDNFIVPHPNYTTVPLPVAKTVTKGVFSKGITSFAGSGPDGLLMGSDFRNAYAPGVGIYGAGQAVALFELDTYYPGDVQRYMSGAGLTNTINNVYLDGWSSSTTPGGGNGEVSLDIDQAMSMAPGAVMYCYMGPNIDDVLNRIATDNLCKQISSSWGWGPSSSAENQTLQQYAAQGQTYFNASGDSGSFTTDPGGNEDDIIQTLVGGTDLNMNGNGASYNSETGWSGTTGGVLTNVTIPSYQVGISMATNGGSTSFRNCPDVSAVASGCVLYANNSSSLIDVGGTSVAAPTWAGFMALVNQQAVSGGKPTVGFLNPLVYAILKGSNYTTDFHDVTSGSAGTFSAVPGYDLVTGIGSPNGQALINDLSQAAGAPTATPTGTPTPVVASTWRVRAGGAAYTDSQSHVWAADENYGGGATNGTTSAITGALPASTDQALYQQERYENPTLTYTFNVPAGSYQVTLKFAELFDNGAGERIENISINGTQVLANFDIFAAAGGLDIAKDEVFNNIASSGGKIVISFSAASGSPDGNAKVDALQIIPQPVTPTNTPTKTNSPTNTNTPTNTFTPVPPTATPTSTNSFTSTPTFTFTFTPTPVVQAIWRVAGGKTTSYTDCKNNVWSPDSNYNAGAFNSNTNAITKALPCTTDQSLYQSEHWGAGSFTYTFNVPAGSYQTTLKFAEIFDGAAGQRIQNVTINGTQVLTNFDIFADAGGINIADDKVFNNISPVNGQIVITLATTSSSPDQNAKISALQIVPQPSTPTFTATSTLTATSTFTSTPTATNTLSSTPTFTLTPTNTGTASFTSTGTPTFTFSSTPSFTATATNSNTATASFTPTSTSTGTVVPPTSTNTFTASFTPTNTSTFSSTATPTLTNTNTFSSTPTPTATATNSSTATNSVTATFTPTNTNTPVPPTATFTSTNSSTATNSYTATSTPTNTATKTFTWTPSFTSTSTPVPPTATPTRTFTQVPPTNTPTKTNTPVPPTATATFTPTPASACSGVAAWNGNFVAYATGSKVTYNNELYQCIQAHTSEPNWMPSVVPALWKDLGPCSNFVVASTSSTVIKSAVAGPNISKNMQPVKFFIQLNSPAQVTVEIFTPMGQLVASSTFYGNPGMNNWLWDIHNAAKQIVSSGLYIYTVQVTSNGNVETKTGKIVIMH
jgi:hypothetical protein